MFYPAASEHLTRRDALRRLGLIGGAAVLSSLSSRSALAATETPVAATLAGVQPAFYRFKIGSLDAMIVNDGQLNAPVAESPYAVGASTEQIKETLQSAYLSPEVVSLAINVLLVKTASELVLIDSGCGPFFGPVGGRMLPNLKAAGVHPDQVTAVVITHLHTDHFGGLFEGETMIPVFKNARYVLGRREHDYWMGNPDMGKSKLLPEVREQFIRGAQKAVTALKGKWELIAPGDKLIDGIEFIEAAGHTPGHLMVGISSGSEQLINFADTAHHHTIAFRHPDWPMVYDGDPELGAQSRKKVLARMAAERARVFGVHMPFPSLGHVRSASGAFEYVPEPWQVV